MQTDNDSRYPGPHPGGDTYDWDRIYLENYTGLYQYAFTILNDESLAEEMIHQVFLRILEKKEPVAIHTSLKAYLYRSVNNESLNHLKHQKVKQDYQAHAAYTSNRQPATPSSNLDYRELEHRLREAMNRLPEQCRTIFQLSRYEELKYAEIASQLGLSVKTVENQISKALKRIREHLGGLLIPTLLLFIRMMS
ncbi:MAG: RNA polymerase sigma-70 factor [Williamsia sp.]|nr:RNA polymerase sigma-70 factor [Williamsia sp.]